MGFVDCEFPRSALQLPRIAWQQQLRPKRPEDIDLVSHADTGRNAGWSMNKIPSTSATTRLGKGVFVREIIEKVVRGRYVRRPEV